MTELEGLIHYWKVTLFYDRWCMAPSTINQVESTIRYLGELKSTKEKEAQDEATKHKD